MRGDEAYWREYLNRNTVWNKVYEWITAVGWWFAICAVVALACFWI